LLECDWRLVSESNPCCRREGEAIFRNSKETCGMDSHRKVVEGILSNRYWTLNGRAETLFGPSCSRIRCVVIRDPTLIAVGVMLRSHGTTGNSSCNR